MKHINKKTLKIASLCGPVLILVLFGLVFVKSAFAGSATVTWSANTEPDLSGYKIYYGTSPRTGTDPKICGLCGYSTNVNVGNVLTYTFSNLTNGQTYYFSVTAYDTSNNESSFSGQVSKAISAADTTAPSTPAGLTATAISSSQINLSWTASTDNVGVTGYRIFRCSGASCTPSTQLGTSVSTSYQDTGLSSATTYRYTVAAYDAAGNVSSQSSIASATTLSTAKPVISLNPASFTFNAVVGGATPSGQTLTITNTGNASLSWAGATQYNWCHISPTSGSASAGGSQNATASVDAPSNVGTFTCTITVSDPNATNSPQTATLTYTVTSVPTDTTPPTISGISASSVTQTSATITWTTNEPADSQVEYGPTTSYGSASTLNSSLITNHSVTLSGLSAGTIYHYRVKSKDAAANLAVSLDYTFTTIAVLDTTPPSAITDLTPQNITQTSVDLVTWTAPGDDGMVGTATQYDLRYSTSSLNDTNFSSGSTATGLPIPLPAGSKQTYVLVGLTPGTSYTAALKTADEVPNWSGISNIISFTTLPVTPVTDTTAPSVPADLTATAVSATQVNLSWTTSTDNIGVIGYRIFRGGVQIGTAATPAYTDSTSLSGGQTYSYAVSAYDAAGNNSAQSSARTITTPLASDITVPSISITSPASNQVVSATITISAAAQDPVVAGAATSGIAGVQFKVDGSNLGSEDIVSPYSYDFDTTKVSNGSHILTATARDNASNIAAAASITITVSNASPAPASPTLTVSLSATPSSGTVPLSGVSLTALVSGTATGSINYYFYCHRTDSDTSTVTTIQPNQSFLAVSNTSQTASSLCTYSSAGTYTAKVIAQRGSAPASESRVNIAVSASAPPITPPAPAPAPGGGVMITDTTPPPQVTDFKAEALDSQVSLSWTNPSGSSDWVRTVIVRKTGVTPPSSVTDGTRIYEGTDSSFIDINLQNNQNYSYSAFTLDRVPNYSQSVTSAATPILGKTQITPTPTSAPEEVFKSELKIGSKNPEVLLLQELLGVTPQTGYFGPLTQAAVKSFQLQYSLSVSGITDIQTRVKLNEVYKAKKIALFRFNLNLRYGMRNNDVKKLQEFLAKDKTVYPEGLVTGYFGNLTLKAVQRFQCKYNIVCSGTDLTTGYGRVGPKTRAKINELNR